jgi:hypothetical protein
MIASRLARQPRHVWRELFPVPEDLPLRRSFADDLKALRRLAWEGLYREDDVEQLLYAVRDDAPLAEVAPDSGALVSRYCALRRELNRIESPELQPYAQALGEIFDYLSQHLHYSVALLAVAWRSERLREQQALLGPVGPPGDRLRRVVAQLDRLETGRSSLEDTFVG